MLLFGLRSALKIYSAVADAVQWILGNNRIQKGLYYLDVIILVAKSLNLAERQKDILLSMFRKLNIPMEESKLEGLSPCLSSLGIEVDTASFQLHPSHDKLANLKISLSDSIQCRTMSQKDLQKLTGLLLFVTKVMHLGRPFLRRSYPMQEIGSLPNHFIRLNLPARTDIMWWYLFVEEWNGLSLLWDLGLQRPNLLVYTNSFGTWECGAFLDPMWFQLQWSDRLNPISIAVREVFPVALATAMFEGEEGDCDSICG